MWCTMYLYGCVWWSWEHVDTIGRLCHSQDGNDADVTTESAFMVQSGKVIHLNVLVVCTCMNEKMNEQLLKCTHDVALIQALSCDPLVHRG